MFTRIHDEQTSIASGSTKEEEVKCKTGMRAVNGPSHAASVLTFNAKKLLATLSSYMFSSIYIRVIQIRNWL
ncbi:hypothetical protein YC2023_104572 [Brassica napus]